MGKPEVRALLTDEPRSSEQHRGAPSRVAPVMPIFRGTDRSAVHLTFDDGPHPEITPQVLDLLARRGHRATFFVLGERVQRHPELVDRIAQEGHAVGIHGYGHRSLLLAGPCRIREELARALSALAAAAPGLPVRLFRPPYGLLNPVGLLVARSLGLRTVLWTIDARDYRAGTPESVLRRTRRLAGRDILLLHDAPPGGLVTVQVLPQILERIEAAGLRSDPL